MIIQPGIEQWALEWRQPMLRFAKLHLPIHADAEDAVQETLAAALQLDPTTLATVDPRSYLFGILRNKVMDSLRRLYRFEISYNDAFEDELDAVLFDEHNHWLPHVAPKPWKSAEQQLLTDQFFKVVDICVEKLPKKIARVFSMKELLECSQEEICETLGISKTDYWQCLSRARKQIHLCLNQTWFDGETLP